MLKILHVVNESFVLPFFIGEQFQYFKKKKNDLHVICSASAHLKSYSLEMGFTFDEVQIKRSISPFKDLNAILKICMYIHLNNIDIVVGHTPKGGLLAMIASWIMRVPKRIYFRHGLVYETMVKVKRVFMINMDRLTAACATKVICVSPSVFNRSIEDCLNNESKQIILNKGTCTGIDTQNKFNPIKIDPSKLTELRNHLQIDEDVFVIGYCGRLVIDKGIIQLIEAFKIINENYKQIKLRLLLAGGFEERDSLPDSIINEIESHPKIIYTGWKFETMEYYYSLMNVFVLPSYREGFPTSILEASSMSLPVITTKVTGCIDAIVEDVTGKFTENNSQSIANSISFYLNNRDISLAHGNNGRVFIVNNFNQKIIWKEIEKQFNL